MRTGKILIVILMIIIISSASYYTYAQFRMQFESEEISIRSLSDSEIFSMKVENTAASGSLTAPCLNIDLRVGGYIEEGIQFQYSPGPGGESTPYSSDLAYGENTCPSKWTGSPDTFFTTRTIAVKGIALGGYSIQAINVTNPYYIETSVASRDEAQTVINRYINDAGIVFSSDEEKDSNISDILIQLGYASPAEIEETNQ